MFERAADRCQAGRWIKLVLSRHAEEETKKHRGEGVIRVLFLLLIIYSRELGCCCPGYPNFYYSESGIILRVTSLATVFIWPESVTVDILVT